MRLRLFVCAATLALAACSETIQPGPAPAAAAAADCAARAMAPWRPLRGQEFQAIAASAGGPCASAMATLSIEDASGRGLFAQTLPAAHVMPLAYAENAQAMQVALSEWVDQTKSSLRTTGELPVWADAAEQPTLGEFPFYPERAFNRTAYAALRTRDVPLFCFAQGMESLACLALEDGALIKVGVQTFPG